MYDAAVMENIQGLKALSLSNTVLMIFMFNKLLKLGVS